MPVDLINNYIWAITSVIGVIVWLVRLESKVKDNAANSKVNATKIESLSNSTDSFREEIKGDIREIKTTLLFIRENMKK